MPKYKFALRFLVSLMIVLTLVTCTIEDKSETKKDDKNSSGIKLTVGTWKTGESITANGTNAYNFSSLETGVYTIYVNAIGECTSGCIYGDPSITIEAETDKIDYTCHDFFKVDCLLKGLSSGELINFKISRSGDAIDYSVIVVKGTGSEGSKVEPVLLTLNGLHSGAAGSGKVNFDDDDGSFYKFMTADVTGDYTITFGIDTELSRYIDIRYLDIDIYTDSGFQNPINPFDINCNSARTTCILENLDKNKPYFMHLHNYSGYFNYDLTISSPK